MSDDDGLMDGISRRGFMGGLAALLGGSAAARAAKRVDEARAAALIPREDSIFDDPAFGTEELSDAVADIPSSPSAIRMPKGGKIPVKSISIQSPTVDVIDAGFEGGSGYIAHRGFPKPAMIDVEAYMPDDPALAQALQDIMVTGADFTFDPLEVFGEIWPEHMRGETTVCFTRFDVQATPADCLLEISFTMSVRKAAWL